MSHISGWQKLLNSDEGRGYLHFDYRCSLKNQNVARYVQNPYKIATHSFYPFVHFQMKLRKLARHPNSNKVYLDKFKIRELFYASHFDRCVYTRYSYILNEKYNEFSRDNDLDSVAIAYRTNLGLCNIDFSEKVFSEILQTKWCLIFVTDFSSFFDTLNHQYLKKQIKKIWNCKEALPLQVQSLPLDIYAIYKNLTRYSYIEKDYLDNKVKESGKKIKDIKSYSEVFSINEVKSEIKVPDHKVGIPQGSPISAVLSNIYMSDIDIKINEIVKSKGGTYRRYCDDVIIVVPVDKESDAVREGEYWEKYFDRLDSSGLIKINKTKTEVRFFDGASIYDLKSGKKIKNRLFGIYL